MVQNDQSTEKVHPKESPLSLWNVSVICLILSGMVVITSRTIADPDLWGHVRFGLDTIQNRGIIRIDPYSYLTAGQPWINHEWLAEVFFAFAWIAAGPTGLIALKTGLWVITYLLLFWYLSRYSVSHLRLGILLFISMTLTFPLFVTVRPHSFTAVFYVIVLISILQAESGKLRSLWVCPIIFVLWPNLHGAFLAGIGILYLWAAMFLLKNRSSGVWRQVLPPVLLCGVALLANPYGLELLTFLFRHLPDSRLEIIEWQPMQLHSITGVFYLLWLLIVLCGLFFSRKPRNPRLMVLMLLTSYLPFMAQRYILFFILTALLFAGVHIIDAWEKFMPESQRSTRRPLWLPVFALITAGLLLAWKWTNFLEIPIKNPESYPINAVSILNQSQVNGNLAVYFDWGDYAIWHLTPKLKVSIDTRREMAYSEQIYKENVRFMAGIGDWSRIIDDHPTYIALVKNASPTDNLLKLRQDWNEIYRDKVGVLYTHKEFSETNRIIVAISEFIVPVGESNFP